MSGRDNERSREALSCLPKLDICELRELLVRAVAYRIQEVASDGPRLELQRRLCKIAAELQNTGQVTIRPRAQLKPRTRLIREWRGRIYEVLVLDHGFSWHGTRYRSLSATARQITGTTWSGPIFFGLRSNRTAPSPPSQGIVPTDQPAEGGDAAG